MQDKCTNPNTLTTNFIYEKTNQKGTSPDTDKKPNLAFFSFVINKFFNEFFLSINIAWILGNNEKYKQVIITIGTNDVPHHQCKDVKRIQ